MAKRSQVYRPAPAVSFVPPGKAAAQAGTAASAPMRRWVRFGLPIIVLIGAILPFGAAIEAEFTNWDDHANITENRDFRGLSPRHFRWFFTTSHVGVYEPLGWLLKAVIFESAGISSRAFHAVSIVLHGCNAVLYYWVARRLLHVVGVNWSQRLIALCAALAALLFGMHPLRTEVVAWASAQPYALAGFFCLASLLCWLWAVDGGATGTAGAVGGGHRYWVGLSFSLALYAAAMLSKTAAISLPLAMLILDAYPLRRLRRGASVPALLEKLPFLAIAAWVALRAVGIAVQTQIPNAQAPLIERLFVALQAPALYLVKALVPIHLTPFYPLPFPYANVPLQFMLVSLATVLITLALVLSLARRKSGPRSPLLMACLAAWLVSLAFIAPTSGIIRHGDAYAADRYAYLSGIGFPLVAAGMAGWAVSRSGGRTVGLVPVCVISAVTLITLGALSWRQTACWHDSGALWRQALRVHPQSWLARHQLAAWNLRRGDPRVAATILEGVLRDCPDYVDAMFTYGSALRDTQRLEDACTWFRKTLERQPAHECLNNLAETLDVLGRTDEAIALLQDRLKRRPDDPGCMLNLGVFLSKRGQAAEGLALFERVTRIQPWNDQALFNYGVASFNSGRLDPAAEALAAALRINPNMTRAWMYVGLVDKAQGRFDLAERNLREFLRVEPQHARARYELGVLLLERGREVEGVSELRIAAADAREPLAAFRLAWVFSTSSDPELRHGAEALRLAEGLVAATQRREPRMLLALAAANAELGQFAAAEAQLAEAMSLIPRDSVALASTAAALDTAIRAGAPFRGVWNENGK